MSGPSQLTPDVHDTIVRLVRGGNYLETAAAAAGIPAPVVRSWFYKGQEEDNEPYTSFHRDVIQAEAEKENDLVQRIDSAGQSAEFWNANAWLLSRRHSKRWQEKVIVEVNNELEKILQHLEERLPKDIFTMVLEAMADTTSRTVKRPVEITSPGARALPPGRAPTE